MVKITILQCVTSAGNDQYTTGLIWPTLAWHQIL